MTAYRELPFKIDSNFAVSSVTVCALAYIGAPWYSIALVGLIAVLVKAYVELKK